MKKRCSVIFALILAFVLETTVFAADYYNEDIGLSINIPEDSFIFYPEMTEEHFARYEKYSDRSYGEVIYDFAEYERDCEIYHFRDGREVAVRIEDGGDPDYRKATEEVLTEHLDRWTMVVGKEAEIFESEIYRTSQTAFIRLVYKYFEKNYTLETYITFANSKMIIVTLYPNGRTVTGDESDYVKWIINNMTIGTVKETESKAENPAVIITAIVAIAAAAAVIIISSVKKKPKIETAPEEHDYSSENKVLDAPEKTDRKRRFCHLCGTKLREGSSFCHECGAPVEK